MMTSQEAEEFIVSSNRYTRTKWATSNSTLAVFKDSNDHEVTIELKNSVPRIWFDDGKWLSQDLKVLFASNISFYQKGARRQSNIKNINGHKAMVRIKVATIDLLAKLLAAYTQSDLESGKIHLVQPSEDVKKPIGFGWVPFYEEMAHKLLDYRDKQSALIKILKDAHVNGLVDENPKGNKITLTEIDPFTFIALLNKQSAPERTRILAAIKPKLDIAASVPISGDFLGIPSVDARQTWLFPYSYQRNPDDVSALWELYVEVLSDKSISNKVFARARAVKYAGHAKLTQAIFRAAPRRYFPVDGQTTSYLAALRVPYIFETATEFEKICAGVRRLVDRPLYQQSYDAWSANQKKDSEGEVEYQKGVLRAATRPKKPVEKKGGVPLPKIGKAGLSVGGYQRNPIVAAEALRLANFKCEIDDRHHTFISNAKNKPYVEAHHLIPFGSQGSYAFSLDVTANIVALCPNCHRQLHHGRGEDKVTEIKSLLNLRSERLREKELHVGEKELLKLYSGELLEADS